MLGQCPSGLRSLEGTYARDHPRDSDLIGWEGPGHHLFFRVLPPRPSPMTNVQSQGQQAGEYIG